MAVSSVRPITSAEDAACARAALLTAFASDPFTRWVFPDPSAYLEAFPHALVHMGALGAPAGRGFLAADRRAAALWIPPGHGSDLEALSAALEGLSMPEEAGEFFEAMAQHHPESAHWYLPFIGVDPGGQGQGLGSALLRAALAQVDADRMPAYLESTNPRNIPLYERFGFRVVGEIQVGTSPPMHPMRRDPR